MENFPPHKEPEIVIEGEIVGHEKPRPLWRRLAGRAAAAALLGLIGLILCAVGAGLILTIVGAAAGVPLVLIGVFCLLGALLMFLGVGEIHSARGRSK